MVVLLVFSSELVKEEMRSTARSVARWSNKIAPLIFIPAVPFLMKFNAQN